MTDTTDPGGLAERLKLARATATRLAEKSNALNAILEKAQDSIAGLRLGVSASILLHIDEEADDYETHLSFQRHEGKWCLAIVEGQPTAESWSTTPLLKASRDLRVQAAHRLPELVDNLLAQTEKEVDAVVDGAEAAAAFIEELREAQARS